MKAVALSALLILAFAVAPTPADARCPNGTYRNSESLCVPRPRGDWHSEPIPSGATTRCNDGTYSFSRHPHAPGTCSYHGGAHDYIRPGPSGTGSVLRNPFKPGPGDPPEKPLSVYAKERPL